MRKEASYISVATALGLLTAAAGGGAWMGAIASDVEALQKQEIQQKEDHDRLIKVEERIKNISDDVIETKSDVKDIKKLLNDLKRSKE
jgi:septal ring factor EnvC (AmiA/AmiB activator)